MEITNPKHKQFVDEYFKRGFNGTQAYLSTYENSSYDTARNNAAVLLARPEISQEIEERLSEFAMSANEVLARLGNIARADFGDFMTNLIDGGFVIDLEQAKKYGLTYLIREVWVDEKIDEDGNVWRKSRVKLHDNLKALQTIAKTHALLTDRVEHEHSWTAYLPEGISESQVIEQFKQFFKDAQSIEGESRLVEDKKEN